MAAEEELRTLPALPLVAAEQVEDQIGVGHGGAECQMGGQVAMVF